jgi:cyanophycinase
MKRLMVTLLMALACASSAEAAKTPPAPTTYFRVGSGTDVGPSVALGGGVVLMGGSTDVDAAFQWMCARAGKGDFLIIRATGTDAYNRYVQGLCPTADGKRGVTKVLNSVATQIIGSEAAANDPTIVKRINEAEAIWIAGGDQSNYINYWQGTPVQDALNSRIAAGAPIGGTSAGLNVLTQYVYSALAATGATSAEALANPFDATMTFASDFVSLPVLANVIGDPHFTARDRMGRDLAFLCRVNSDFKVRAPRGIAVDEQTALEIDTTTRAGTGTVVGNGNVYFLQAPGAPTTCTNGQPLTYENVAVQRVGPGGTFDLANWSGSGVTRYSVSATNGVLSSTGNGGLIY